jgi:hypothetical protein
MRLSLNQRQSRTDDAVEVGKGKWKGGGQKLLVH